MNSSEDLSEEQLLAHLAELHRQLSEVRDQAATQERQLVAAGVAQKRVLIVTNRLPVKITRGPGSGNDAWIFEPQSGSVVSALLSLTDLITYHWFACCDLDVDYSDQDFLRKKLRQDYNAVPVFLPAEMRDQYYNGFCKQTMWPLLHYVLGGGPGGGNFDDKLWQAYCSSNLKFAEAVTEVFEEGDLVWIHDYHLMLLPSLLRKRLRHVNIGFFLHTPFPSSEIFRMLPVRLEVLQGVLASDLIGFNTYDYSRHFLTSCSRLLGLECSPKGTFYDDHFVSVGVFPIGIDPQRFVALLATPEVQGRVQKLRKKYAGKKILIGVDPLDYIKGMPHKLLGLEAFLLKYPDWKGRLIMIQVAEPPAAETISEYKRLQRQVNEMVGRINGRFASVDFSPIHYLNQTVQFEELCALYSIADACIITSVRDGMNLTAHEYIICSREKEGALILSEFAGSAQSLSGAIRVNPWDTEEVCQAIHEALTMHEQDRKRKHQQLYNYVSTHTSVFWGKSFIEELREAGHRASLSFRALPSLDVHKVLAAYSQAKNRMIVLDYDGSLIPTQSLAQLAAPPQQLLTILTSLCKDPANTVFIVSGRDQKVLSEWFGEVSGLGLAAEHGWHLRWPHQTKWEQMLPSVDLTWMDSVLPIFKAFTDRTPGSYVEHKESAITWHYRDADADFGSWQAKELQEFIGPKLSNVPVEVILGDQEWVTVRPQGVNKGQVVESIRERLVDNGELDFVLCIGDDRTDEDMFQVLKGDPQRTFTCKIGKKGSQANYCLADASAATSVIHTLAAVSDATTSQDAPAASASGAVPLAHPEPYVSPRSPALGANSKASASPKFTFTQPSSRQSAHPAPFDL